MKLIKLNQNFEEVSDWKETVYAITNAGVEIFDEDAYGNEISIELESDEVYRLAEILKDIEASHTEKLEAEKHDG